MEEDTVKETPSTTTVVTPVQKKDPFSMIGKIVVVLLIAALLVGGGYVLATKLNTKKTDTTVQKMLPPTEATATPASTDSATPSPTKVATTKTSGGLGGNATSFKQYSVDVPTGWTSSKDKTEITDKLTLAKGAYSISIYQAPMGGSMCSYKGDPPQEMSQSFSNFVSIAGTSPEFRRSWNTTGNPAGTISYTVCQKGTDSYGSFTSFGAISIKSPENPDEATMKEIDAMLVSLKQN